MARYLTPSAETLCYLTLPNRDAIDGALVEHQQEQDISDPHAWGKIVGAIGKELRQAGEP